MQAGEPASEKEIAEGCLNLQLQKLLAAVLWMCCSGFYT